jgi:glycosyltransferase involved in cell wall biosynthesis
MDRKPLNICMVVRALPCHRQGGLEYHAWDLANALTTGGHFVTLLTSQLPTIRGSEEAKPVSPACPPTTQQPRIHPGAGARLKIEEIPGTIPGQYSAAFYRNLDRTIERLERLQPFDVIHVQELAGLFMRARPGRLVVTVHGTMTSETPLYRDYFRRLSIAEKLAALWRYKSRLALLPAFPGMLKRADRLIVDSDFTRRELLLQNPSLREKIELVPLGIDPTRYPEANSPPRTLSHIGVIGRVQKMKGVMSAVRGAAVLKSRGVQFEMLIAGRGPDTNHLQQLIAELGVSDCVRFIGPVGEGSELAKFFAGLDVLLFPDLTQPAFGLVAVEAMHYGVPVVASRSGAIPEVVTDQVGWLYDPWSELELAATLRLALSDREQLQSKSAAARERATQYIADRMAKEVERVYRMTSV